MERIHGDCIAYGWSHRSEESKSRLLEQLKSMIDQMRSIPPSVTSVVANVRGGPVYDQRLPGKAIWGPFPTINAFHKELRNGIEAQNLPKDETEFETEFPGMKELISFHDQSWRSPVFTHGDLSSFNILVYGDRVKETIDWETAGWMPSYWEYTSAWHVNPRNEFWREEVNKFLTPLPHALKMEIVRRKYFGDY